MECARKATAEDYPRNFALIRLAERTAERQRKEQEEQAKKQTDDDAAAQVAAKEIEELQAQIAKAEEEKKAAEAVKVAAKPKPEDEDEDMCPEHGRKLEIICIQCRVRICSTCALFGAHKGHDVRMEQEVVNELTIRTELLI